jgi:hypothetical protein
MRVRRGLLFWGLLLIPLGAIPLLVRAGQLDSSRIMEVWRLWPLIVVGVGLLVLASRTRLAFVGVIVVALTIGSIGGAALASGNVFLGAIGACGATEGSTALDRTGTFSGPGSVRLNIDCGSLDLKADASTDWSVHAVYRGDAPILDAAANQLDVRTPSGSPHRQDWTIRLPATTLRSLNLTANAAAATIDLGPAQLDGLQADFNAGDVRILSGSGSIANIDATMNAGRLRLTLGPAAIHGSLSVNAGGIDVCVPPQAGLSFHVDDQLTFVTNLSSRGLTRNGNTWTRAGTGGQTIDLSVSGNAASFTLDPNGGC